MSFRSALFALSAIAAFAIPASGASAASQVLGLVASNGVPTPLICVDGQCSAQFSTFCLQQSRPAPRARRLWRGRRRQLDAGCRNGGRPNPPPAGRRRVDIHSLIGFTSVEISLPPRKLAELGATAVRSRSGRPSLWFRSPSRRFKPGDR